MHKALVLTGVILMVVGIATIAYSDLLPVTTTVFPYPGAVNPFPPLVTATTLSVTWSGGTSTSAVELFQCATSACTTIGAIVVNKTGASGSFTATLQPGTSYAWTVFGGTAVSVTFTLWGVTYLFLVGVVLLVVGALILMLGFWRRKKETPTSPNEPTEAEAPRAAEPEGTTSEGPGGRPALEATPSDSTARPNRQCDHCGTFNEPWITNCRKCKRALASTSRS